MTRAARATAVIAAAGSGERLGAGDPKALVPLGGRPMLAWSLAACAAAATVGPVVVAAPADHLGEIEGEEDGVTVVAGGESRSESVARALEAVETELVVVHDAARPLVTAGLIDAVVGALEDDPSLAGVVAAAPVTDTVKEAGESLRVQRTLDRSGLWAAQTPQAFRAAGLREAAAQADLAAATDDSMLVERAGGPVLLHPAPAENLKVTSALDLRVAELLIAERDL